MARHTFPITPNASTDFVLPVAGQVTARSTTAFNFRGAQHCADFTHTLTGCAPAGHTLNIAAITKPGTMTLWLVPSGAAARPERLAAAPAQTPEGAAGFMDSLRKAAAQGANAAQLRAMVATPRGLKAADKLIERLSLEATA